jgi:sec-independent protein translocase protein TatB
LLLMMTPPTIQYANLGMWDSLLLMVMALVVFGPRRLPEIGRQIGKLMYEFRKASNDFKFQMEEELRNSEESDRRKKEEERLRLMALNTSPATPVASDASTNPQAATEASAGDLSPYPGEEVYPPIIDGAAEIAPLIQPPSTGQTVSASEPWHLETELAALATAGTEPITPSAQVTSTENSAPQVVKHG